MPIIPKVIVWYKVYCWILVAMYVLVAAASIPFFVLSPEVLDMNEPFKTIVGIMFLVMGLLLAALSLLPLIMKPRPWLWIYGLVTIGLGLTSICFWPICIPLLIYWLRDDARAYYQRGLPPTLPAGGI